MPIISKHFKTCGPEILMTVTDERKGEVIVAQMVFINKIIKFMEKSELILDLHFQQNQKLDSCFEPLAQMLLYINYQLPKQ